MQAKLEEIEQLGGSCFHTREEGCYHEPDISGVN